MLNLANPDDLRSITYTVGEILKADKLEEISDILNKAQVSIEQTGYDNWNGGMYLYTVYINIDIQSFVSIRDKIQTIEATLLEKFNLVTRQVENEAITNITFIPRAQYKVDWSKLGCTISREKLIDFVNYLKTTMISVATGGQRIQEVNVEYKSTYMTVDKVLQKLNISNPNPYTDLWQWYSKWRSTFNHYRERRTYITEMYSTIFSLMDENGQPELISVTVDLTDWERIERSVNEIRVRQAESQSEEQYQVVGLLSRETIITLAQAVFNKDRHPILDGKEVSKTDAKRMLEAYIAVELVGSSNETLRRYARATLDLANELTHKRTASNRDAALCATATISIINLVGTIEGRI